MPGKVGRPGWAARSSAVAGLIAVALLLVLSIPEAPSDRPVGPVAKSPHLTPAAKSVTPPGALHIPLSGPVANFVYGTRVNVTYEYQALNWSWAWKGVAVRVPTVSAVFTQKSGVNYYIPITNRNLTIPGPGWTNGSTTHATKVVTSTVLLNPTIEPFLTTVKLAVMANATHGTFRLAFRWSYSIWNVSNGTTLQSNWSIFGNLPNYQSTVYPAPLIFLDPATKTTMAVGSKFTARLLGLVSNVSFYLEMENAFTGIHTAAIREPSPLNITSFTVWILTTSSKGYTTPGPYLVHVHDAWGDILYSISVHLFAPTNAQVFFRVVPASCGTVYFNGTAHANGTNIARVPTGLNYTVNASACVGYNFTGWTQSGGGLTFSVPASNATMGYLRYNVTMFANYA